MPLPKQAFLRSLDEGYRLWSSRLRVRDVPLPYLRDHVCSDLDITWRRFDEALKKLGTDTNGMRIDYSQSRFGEKWGLDIGGKNMYYMALQF
jgi:hypothetical protein